MVEREQPEYYSILGVSPTASATVIKKVYRGLCKTYHTDGDPYISASEDERKHAKERLQEINEAYEVLGDPEKRGIYDAKLAEQKRHEDRLREEEKTRSVKQTACEHIRNLYEGGDIKGALREASELFRRFPEDADLQNTYASLLYEWATKLAEKGNLREATNQLKLSAEFCLDAALKAKILADLEVLRERSSRSSATASHRESGEARTTARPVGDEAPSEKTRSTPEPSTIVMPPSDVGASTDSPNALLGALVGTVIGFALIAVFSQHISYVPYSPGSYLYWSHGPILWGKVVGSTAGLIGGIIFALTSAKEAAESYLGRILGGILLLPIGAILGALVGWIGGMLLAFLITGLLPLLLGIALGVVGGALLADIIEKHGHRDEMVAGCLLGALAGGIVSILAWANGNRWLADTLFVSIFAWIGYAGKNTIEQVLSGKLVPRLAYAKWIALSICGLLVFGVMVTGLQTSDVHQRGDDLLRQTKIDMNPMSTGPKAEVTLPKYPRAVLTLPKYDWGKASLRTFNTNRRGSDSARMLHWWLQQEVKDNITMENVLETLAQTIQGQADGADVTVYDYNQKGENLWVAGEVCSGSGKTRDGDDWAMPRGFIVCSADGGKKWVRQWISDNTHPEPVYGIYFSDASEGWALTIKQILHTSDKGVSWNQILKCSNPDQMTEGPLNLFILDRTKMVVIDSFGDHRRFGFYFFFSMNKGVTWDRIKITDESREWLTELKKDFSVSGKTVHNYACEWGV